MNLVIGATGMVGSEICRLLRKENAAVRAMVRNTSNPAKVNNLRELGVEIIQGDLRKTSTFKPALQGVNAIVTTASSIPFAYEVGENDPVLVDRNGIISLIDEAKQARVKHFVYTSFSGNIDLDFPLRNAKRAVEQHLQECGMVYTILRPGYFMEGWLSALVGFDVENAKVQLCGEGTNPVSYISYLDVAQFAFESLQNPHARDTILELGGPEKLSQLDAVRIFEEITQRKIRVQHVSVEALQSQLDTATDLMQKSFSGLMLCLANGDPIRMEKILKKFPIQLKSVREYAKSTVTVG